MVMNEFGETGEGHGVDVLDVVVEDILTPVEEGAYDVMAVTEYVDYETEPDRYIREIEEAMQCSAWLSLTKLLLISFRW